ncbi:MAG: ImmA/IrrE family metallo-endopeptidase [Proteobacteria bacterium]|nr:ImmA/IrrE family metallo-endopeptidase [Pseudomonadota bacterium]MBS1936678.1 ImmA/IrrE family metallo-endopeptidase [Bacteroidota bacterium]
MTSLALQPDVLRWARERAGFAVPEFAKKAKIKPEKVLKWELTGELTFGQVEALAQHTHTPIGHLFLSKPLKEKLSIPDFRTVGDHAVGDPSPDLLDTVQTMQRRQDWMRNELIEQGQEPLSFIGQFSLKNKPEDVAADMRKRLGLETNWAKGISTWLDALTKLRRHVQDIGILIVFNSVVGNNTSRKLDPEEFRGFALCDVYAPLVFINASDAKSAQMFTLAHELAHLWLGLNAVSGFDATLPADSKSEKFCNKVAAEFLIPAKDFPKAWEETRLAADRYTKLAKQFKVSPIVAARRALDLNYITYNEFSEFYREYVRAEFKAKADQKGKPTYFDLQHVRVGERFGRSVVSAAKEGRLLYREAFQLVGISGATFDKFAKDLGVED